MIFNNLIYLIVVIVALGTRDVPAAPVLPATSFLAFFLLKGLLFWQLIRLYLKRQRLRGPGDYFRAEKNLSGLAVVFFLADIYLLGIHYYLGLIPGRQHLPSLVDLAGLGCFYLYLLLLWALLKPRYEAAFGVKRATGSFLWEQLRNSAALVLPWVLLIFLYDLLALVPYAPWQKLLETAWGELAVFVLFLVLLVVWFPTWLVRLMGCRPLPAGATREMVEGFCARLGVEVREICLWPIFEGKFLTAGVMGFTRRSRFLLLTPALLAAVTPEELEAVLAHEMGHVKRHHLFFYLLLFLAFGVLIQLGFQPFIYGLLNSRLFYELLYGLQSSPDAVLTFLTGLPVVLLALLYFRFIFGFFMRNFERQADLHAFRHMGGAGPLIAVFEKIAWLSGQERDRHNWHHFGLGERIAYLEDLQSGKRKPAGQDFKVYASLVLYFLVVALVGPLTWEYGNYLSATAHPPGAKFAQGLIERQVQKDPNNPLWLQLYGDLMAGQNRYDRAVAAYEKSLRLDRDNPEVLNNLAWHLLTAEDSRWHQPQQALVLAQRAAALAPQAHILDTLAEAYWQNGQAELAVKTEKEAAKKATANQDYYLKQLAKFRGGESDDAN